MAALRQRKEFLMATLVSEAPPVPAEGARAVYTRIAALGLVLIALAPATVLIAAQVAGMSIGGEGAFFGITIAVPLITAGLVWRFGAWAKVLGIVVALAAGFVLSWMAFGLVYPTSVADFLPGVLLVLGVTLAVAGGVAAIVQRRRGRLAVSATRAERRIAAVAVGVAVVALAVSGTLTLIGRSPAGSAGQLTVSIKDFTFDAETYTVPAGEPTTLTVRNDDPFVHTFTVPELGIDEVVPPGGDTIVEVTAAAGSYTLYCKPHADMSEPDPAMAGMAATIVAD
jgi:plastocyanin